MEDRPAAIQMLPYFKIIIGLSKQLYSRAGLELPWEELSFYVQHKTLSSVDSSRFTRNRMYIIIWDCCTDISVDKEEGGAVDMEASYQRSSQYQATEHKLSAIMDNLKARETMKVAVSKPLSYATSFFWQVSLLYT